MELMELKRAIQDGVPPKKIAFVDNNHLLTKEYIKAFSKVLNKKAEHFYTSKDVKSVVGRFDRNNVLAIIHSDGDTTWTAGLDINAIYICSEAPTSGIPTVVMGALNKKQCILYLENYLIENKFFKETKDKVKIPTLSRENIEKLIDYFDSDIDQIMSEIDKLTCLEVKALDRPFQALFDCLPPKPVRLKSLPWYSGGAVDTATVLYNTYMKKLRNAGEMNVSISKQEFYAYLVKEAIFVEINILAGTFGDYAIEYFHLLEKIKPTEDVIQWFPPVTRSEIGKEWDY